MIKPALIATINKRTGKTDKIKRGERSRRTVVMANIMTKKHQDHPILVRALDPSPPDHNTVGHNMLCQILGDSPSQGSVQGCSSSRVMV